MALLPLVRGRLGVATGVRDARRSRRDAGVSATFFLLKAEAGVVGGAMVIIWTASSSSANGNGLATEAHGISYCCPALVALQNAVEYCVY